MTRQKLRSQLCCVMLALAVSSAAACRSSPGAGEGSVQFIASMSSALSASDITSLVLAISGPGIPDPLSNNLTKTGNSWQGVIGHIPAGPDRLFRAEARDALGAVIYAGEASAAILAGQTAVVSLTLQQLAPPPPFSNAAPI